MSAQTVVAGADSSTDPTSNVVHPTLKFDSAKDSHIHHWSRRTLKRKLKGVGANKSRGSIVF